MAELDGHYRPYGPLEAGDALFSPWDRLRCGSGLEPGASQMEDAPPPTQPSRLSEEARRVSSRTIRRPGWQNTPEGYVNRGKMAAKRGKK